MASLGCCPKNGAHFPVLFFDHFCLGVSFDWALRMAGVPSEFPPYCFSETRNSFTKSENQPICSFQGRDMGSSLGKCEWHLPVDGQVLPNYLWRPQGFLSKSDLILLKLVGGCLGTVVTPHSHWLCSFLKLFCGGEFQRTYSSDAGGSHHVAAEGPLQRPRGGRGHVEDQRCSSVCSAFESRHGRLGLGRRAEASSFTL